MYQWVEGKVTPRLEIVNSVEHRDVRMYPRLPQYPYFVPILLGEFTAAAACCPIFLAKDQENGQFYAAALFGFSQDQLLVDGADEGKAAFQPLDLQRQGFYASGEHLAIDLHHPRFSDTAPLPLFTSSGEVSEELRYIQHIIGRIMSGREETTRFIEDMLRLKAVEPIDISLAFDNGENLTLEGLYTISQDVLQDLDGAAVASLFRTGHLQAALSMRISLGQIPVLAHRRNARVAEPA
ncbi:MAG: SapC family protein [Sphingomonadales bacterium]|nr:SapC family protein [Sphingomonadales bacterium]MDE2168506.1 SapC family protein [Sphingomonadales bacterium]